MITPWSRVQHYRIPTVMQATRRFTAQGGIDAAGENEGEHIPSGIYQIRTTGYGFLLFETCICLTVVLHFEQTLEQGVEAIVNVTLRKFDNR